MSSSEDRILQPRVRIMQVIAFALITGVAVFLAVVAFLTSSIVVDRQNLPVITLVAAVMLFTNAPLAFALPALMARGQLARVAGQASAAAEAPDSPARAAEVGRLLDIVQTTLIVRLALLEGAAFLGCIAYLIERQQAALLVPGVAVLLMLVFFPTAGRVQDWLGGLRQQLVELRRTSPPRPTA